MERLSVLDEYYADGCDDGSSSSDEEQVDWLAQTCGPGRRTVVEGGDADSIDPRFAIDQRLPTNLRHRSAPKSDSDEFAMDCEMELNAAFEQHNERWMKGMPIRGGGNASTSVGKIKSVGKLNVPTVTMTDLDVPTTSADGSTCLIDATKDRAGALKTKESTESHVDPALALDEEDVSDEEFQKEEGLAQPTDDELLYDPDLDAGDQAWVDKHRRSYLPKSHKSSSLPSSDAVLNCPACMTVLCLDCQRHEIYKTQYRAMFVLNCIISDQEPRHCPLKKRGGRKLRKRKLSEDEDDTSAPTPMEDVVPENARPEDVFHPVLCQVCKTEVAVYDSDEVYHFHNTLASHC